MDELENKNQSVDNEADNTANNNQKNNNQEEKDPISKEAIIGLIIFVLVIAGIIVGCYFLGLFNFKEEKVTPTPTPRGIVAIEDAEIGDNVVFGKYDKNNNYEDGVEDLEWTVIDIVDDHKLLITKEAIECRPYHSAQRSITWADSGLRYWLNGSFYNIFSDEDKKHILKTQIEPEKNPDFDTDAGKPSTDRFFILSLSEVLKYFPTEESRVSSLTTTAIAQGAYYTFVNNEYQCWWWLRNPGEFQDNAMYVHRDGRIMPDGNYVFSRESCIRPAFWYSLPEIVEETPTPSN